ncbi:tRNA (adenine(22)-N(1))-methyltransferase TrmK [Heliobacterium chlorum]|uniref:tRNA (Adenine(22)-N(1))-methyltransferase TrmK n=1 Tax=Heliobacterium chlorum TaxID=2698 RepID=A0ABR7SXD4_HELCL|nr:class I SAM-dependent methyltransferase [Heliobacterium chlorum]MBC9783197.1 tRNA (adenine(22)-N(1))-methyltransferase TrmK [Heliobacterium chlorum]
MPELSPRLQRIADAVPQGSFLADIGTDHAYLPVYLVKKGIIPRAIGVEVHPGPLEAAKQHVIAFRVSEQIDIRPGDGLAPLHPGEVQAITIAGMGGGTIQSILEAGEKTGKLTGVSRLILQPLEGAKELRQWLSGHGWSFVEEDLVAEGHRIYEVIVLDKNIKSEPPMTILSGTASSETSPLGISFSEDVIWELGPLLLQNRHPLLIQVVERLLERDRRALEGLQRARNRDESAIKKKKMRVEELERVRVWLSHALGSLSGSNGLPPKA